jgi:hypothetical protein
MSDYISRVTRISVLPKNEPLFSYQCTHITIVDDAAGEYLEIEQQHDNQDVKAQSIEIIPEQWPAMKRAIGTLIDDIHHWEKMANQRNK